MGVLVVLAGCGGGGGGSGSNPNPPPAVDTTPNALVFTNQPDAPLSAAVSSNEITVTGINANAAVTITGGEYSIDGGAYTSAAGTVANNQKIRVRVNSSPQFSTASVASLTVGGVVVTFTATTVAVDTTPDAFQFPKSYDATRNAWITSASVTIAGINTTTPVVIENGEYSIDGGAFTAAAGTISAGQTLAVKTQVAGGYAKATRARITVGTVSSTFEVIAELPNYVPDRIEFDGQDVIYLHCNAYRLVFRWSISEGHYLGAFDVGASPTTMAYSGAHHRLYFGYGTGAIKYIDVTAANPVEVPFAAVPLSVAGLTSTGNFVMAQDATGAWATHWVFNAAGVVTAQVEWNRYSSAYAWDPNTSRIYFFRDDTSPNDLHFEVIDQTTGAISASGETPYHGDYGIVAPIRVSTTGKYVLLGSGDIYRQSDLQWSGSVGGSVTDARWFANDSLVALNTSGGQTSLRRASATNLATLEQRTYAGQGLRVVGSDTKMVVVVIEGGTVRFKDYVPNDDGDGDGVPNTQDAFPLDVAASADSDRDGYPDAWNAGRSQADSTTGLTLDAYPQDAACYLPAHGTGTVCDYGATMPNYAPDKIVQNGDVVYLLSAANRRVYRWSIAAGRYLNPYVVGLDQGFSTLSPQTIGFSDNHHRLYLGYGNGVIRYIDVNATVPVETQFANTSTGVIGLASAGKYMLAATGSISYVLDSNGAVTANGWGYYYGGGSRDYAWDATSSRIYFFRDGLSPNDLHFSVIDQTNGTVTSAGETPYHGSYNIDPPIRVSSNGQLVLLGSGDLYAQSGLTWAGAIGAQVADARWFANGSLVTLMTASNQTTLRRLSATNLATLEQLTYAGTALRVVGTDTKMAVIVFQNSTVKFYSYLPSDDSDGDGVLNTADAFPLDSAASVDTDHDGYPNLWNPGKTQADSTTGLVLDAFPNDAACWLSSHGNGGPCDYGATIPAYVPNDIAQNGDTIYLLSTVNKRVYRRSISTGQYLNPYVVGISQGFTTLAPVTMAFSASHHKLYLGYSTGAIRAIDVNAGPEETAFANVSSGVTRLVSGGNWLFVQASGGSSVFNAAGVITGTGWAYYGASSDYAWDANTSRLYFFRDGLSPNDLHYASFDSAGAYTGGGETPYHGAYSIIAPIRVSGDGQNILLGSGDIYSQSGLTWTGSLGFHFNDARWLANGSLVTIASSSNQTTVRRLAPTTHALVEQFSFTGSALRVLGSDTAMVLLTVDNGTVQFRNYAPSNDTDGDGVANTADAFPLDPAASVDTDHDGHPNAWNAGKSQADSNSGLTLDSFPNDSACWAPGHSSGGVCNLTATLPSYVPDKVLTNGNTVYLLSIANKRVYRWSIATGQYLNPYVVGLNLGPSTLAPSKMEFSPTHNRLYFGYDTGAIQYLDVTATNPVETPFANLATGVGGLGHAGNFLLAQDYSGAWATHYIINSSGVIVHSREWNYGSPDYAWDPVTSRSYFFRDQTPGDLHFEVVNQTTGVITSAGETPYHGDYGYYPPIRVSANGENIVIGSGDVYRQSDLQHVGTLSKAVTDAYWKDSLLVDLDTTDKVEIRNATTRVVLKDYQYLGTPVRMVFGTSEAYLVHIVSGTTAFVRLPFYDQDADQMPNWWETLYGLNDSSAADATTDLDGDGVNNRNEYLNGSRPNAADTDGDGLTDSQEIVTYTTSPVKADTDGDGLSDGEEVNTHLTDPKDTDSDNDSFSDFDEVRFGGDPLNAASLPLPLSAYSQTFEGSPNLSLWSNPPGSDVPWAVSSSTAQSGTKSYKTGAITAGQATIAKLRGYFKAGTLAFAAKVDTSGSYDSLNVWVDGSQYMSLSSGATTPVFYTQSIPLSLGIHEIEWRYSKTSSQPANVGAAWIDDVTFVAN